MNIVQCVFLISEGFLIRIVLQSGLMCYRVEISIKLVAYFYTLFIQKLRI